MSNPLTPPRLTTGEHVIVDELKRLQRRATIRDIEDATGLKNQTIRLYLSWLIDRKIVRRVDRTRPGIYGLVGYDYRHPEIYEPTGMMIPSLPDIQLPPEITVDTPLDEGIRQQLLLRLVEGLDDVIKCICLLSDEVHVLQVRGKCRIFDENWLEITLGFDRSKWGYAGRSWKWVKLVGFVWGNMQLQVFRNQTYTAEVTFNVPMRIGGPQFQEWWKQVDDYLDLALKQSRYDQYPVLGEVSLDLAGGVLFDYLEREHVKFQQVYKTREKARKAVHAEVRFDQIFGRLSGMLSRWRREAALLYI